MNRTKVVIPGTQNSSKNVFYMGNMSRIYLSLWMKKICPPWMNYYACNCSATRLSNSTDFILLSWQDTHVSGKISTDTIDVSLHPCHLSHKIDSCHNGAALHRMLFLASRKTLVLISYESHQRINNHWKPSFTCIMRMNAFILHSISCHSIVFYYRIYHIYSTITTHSFYHNR